MSRSTALRVSRSTALRVFASAASLACAGALLGVGLPWVTGVGWPQIGLVLSSLSALTVLGLVALWVAALWSYTYVLTASLPGLTNTRAFALNVVGTAVSNLLPFGGAVGVAVTFPMARGWGHDRRAVMASAVVSNLWNVLARLLLPALGLAALAGAGHADSTLKLVAALASAALVVVVLGTATALSWAPTATLLGAAAEAVGRLLPRRWRPVPGRPGGAVARLRDEITAMLRRAWAQLTAGMLVSVGCQGVLFWGCLHAAGARPSPAIVVAAFALSRALTVVPLTPNGIGVSETGASALLVTVGGVAPGSVAAGILVFALITHALEIPAGGIAWSAWALTARRRRRAAAGG